MESRQIIGRKGEALAGEYLEAMGMVILSRNFRCKGGEIDIVAAFGDEIHIVEVKSRSQAGEDTIASSLGAAKLKALHRASLVWLSKCHIEYDYEVIYDLITVIEDEGGEAQLEYTPSFFYPSW